MPNYVFSNDSLRIKPWRRNKGLAAEDFGPERGQCCMLVAAGPYVRCRRAVC